MLKIIVKIIKMPINLIKKLFLKIKSFFKRDKKVIKTSFNQFINHIDMLKSRKIDFKAVYSDENEKIELLFEKSKNTKDK